MSLKLIENECGFTYTLEAIVGVVLIISTVLFVTNNLPYTAQNTGEHSKVQLMNIGRDALDRLEVTPVTDIFPFYWEHSVYRNYTLAADKTFVTPGENITFTVYKLGMGEILYKDLLLKKTVLGLYSTEDMGTINGTFTTSFSTTGEYNIRATEYVDGELVSWSNYVTIKVGYYFLESDVSGISAIGDKNVSGVVYDPSGSGKTNLSIEILNYQYDVIESQVTFTSEGRIIEDCESVDNWISSNPLFSSTIAEEGNSIAINGTTSFWLQKTNSTSYNLSHNDILSFSFFSQNANESIDVKLSNSSGALIWENIDSLVYDWNKINIKLSDPDIEQGTIQVESVDTIRITVSNITDEEDYFFDNLITGEGSFSFEWPLSGNGQEGPGTYYIQSNNSIGRTSNQHRIIFAVKGLIISEKYVIYEGESTHIVLDIPGPGIDNLDPTNNFNINQRFYNNNFDTNKIYISDPIDPLKRKVIFTANTSGDYYIFYGNSGMGGGGDPAAAAKSNTILIHVLPIDEECLVQDCFVCGGIDLTRLNDYLKRYMPPYVNYNLYLINPDGSLCYDCPEFREIINGHPTDEAVTVNKIIHLNQKRDLGFMREIRMVLWYK